MGGLCRTWSVGELSERWAGRAASRRTMIIKERNKAEWVDGKKWPHSTSTYNPSKLDFSHFLLVGRVRFGSFRITQNKVWYVLYTKYSVGEVRSHSL